ncbi:polyprenyl synthetase family protein, partial [Spirochaetota bacterium]
MNIKVVYNSIKNELKLVEKNLFELSDNEDPFISETVLKLLNAGGKRLRPALLLLSSRSCNYSGDRDINLATAIELIHTASLVHDDVLDNAVVRRGDPTVNSHLGNKVSILIGDYLYSRAFTILADDADREIISSIGRATTIMTQGEISQIMNRNNP